MCDPILEYALVIWTSNFKTETIAIENVQRRATKILIPLQIAHLTYSERLQKLGQPTLEYMRDRSDVIQTYKLLQVIDKT